MTSRLSRFLFVPFLLLCFNLAAQVGDTYEFIGTIQLSDKTLLTYKIEFTEQENGKITGKSVTDFSGSHRTESAIKGVLDKSKKKISFEEIENISTKSDFPSDEFCYVHLYNAKIKLGRKKSIIQGHFFSRYPDGKICVEGDIYLLGEEYYFNKMDGIAKKRIIPKDKREAVKQVTEHSKRNVKEVILKDDEQLNITTSNDVVSLKIFDNEYIDGDQISVYVNDKLFLENYIVQKAINTIEVPLNSELTQIKILAINEGKFPPNSASVILSGTSQDNPMKIKLNKGKSAIIKVKRIAGN